MFTHPMNYSIFEILHTKGFIQYLNDPIAAFLFAAIQNAIRTHMPTVALEKQLFNYVCSPGMQSKMFTACNSFFSHQARALKRKSDNERQGIETEQSSETQGRSLLYSQGNRKKQKVTPSPRNSAGPPQEPFQFK